MKKWNVILSNRAEANLGEICAYISEELLEPNIAVNQIKRIRQAIVPLETMPERCPLFLNEPWRSQGLRRLVIGKYIAVYKILEDKDVVLVLTVINGRRDIEELLKQENFSNGGESPWQR